MRQATALKQEQPIDIQIDSSCDDLLTPFGKAVLENQYLLPGETYQGLFARVARRYGDDLAHAQRLYDYISKLWFMPATPILANGGTSRGLPISCYLSEADDSLDGIIGLWTENAWITALGGGIGNYWGNVRSIGEKVGRSGKTSGVIPFMKVTDSMVLGISQGSLRRGAAALYLRIDHPEIEEFMEVRRPTGGDPNRKALNLHHGVIITDEFMHAVAEDKPWHLRSPKDGSAVHTVQARSLWIRLLTTRMDTGEPYLLFIDHINRAIPEHHRQAKMLVKTSNLCSEITLPTGKDFWGKNRTAVCCLSSVNAEKFLEWEQAPMFMEDIMRFLDNVLQDFIDNAPEPLARAKYSAMRERSVGLGVMGFHSFLQSLSVPIEGVMAKVWNKRIFEHIKTGADAASKTLAAERGACPDAAAFGVEERFSNKIAVAPTASISIICGGASPGIEPNAANAYTHKTLSGSFPVRNPHLMKVLEEKGQNTEATWSSIVLHEGSVQHLEFLTPHEKDVFKTAFEIDQRWLVDLAGDRQPFVCQAQSLNIFLPADVQKRDLHQIHWMAWEKKVKSLYYLRSKSLQRSESRVSADIAWERQTQSNAASGKNPNDGEECLACQ